MHALNVRCLRPTICCAVEGKPFWVSWTLEDSEHARLRSGESLQVHNCNLLTSTVVCTILIGQVMHEPVVHLAVC